MKKQIPILMSTMMVQAILAGRKTMTRRNIKPQPVYDANHPWIWNPRSVQGQPFYFSGTAEGLKTVLLDKDLGLCPYGIPGDVVYIREEYYQLGHWEQESGVKTKTGRMKWKFVPDNPEISFEAPAMFRKGRHHKDSATSAIHKRLGRFMPKQYSRIWLEVTDIRVERLQDISEGDAKAEGVEPNCAGSESCPSSKCKESGCQASGEYFHYMRDFEDFPAFSAKESFESLWQKINGADSWEADPWVWVVSFKVLSTTGKPAELEKEEAV